MNAVASSMINGLLSIKPLASFAKNRARSMMMDRAETIGVYWREEASALRARGEAAGEMSPHWEQELAAITDPDITYPPYYTTSFHAYDEGNLGWLPALEVDVAARAVHARIWPDGDDRAGIQGDPMLRASYHQAIKEILETAPQDIVDLGASTGRSTFALQTAFPTAQLTAVELSPYFLAVARYTESQDTENQTNLANPVHWVHATAEKTGLPPDSADLVSACLLFHELPTSAARDIVAEAYRLVRPGGSFAMMDMNPSAEVYRKMPPYILTLLKSTEPYLDQYFGLDMDDLFQSAGFASPRVVANSPRHRTIVGQKRS